MSYYKQVEKYGLYPDFTLPVDKKRGLKISLNYLFDGIDFEGSRVLDVGAGDGKHSLYMLYQGAEVTALEPEEAGSAEGGVISILSELACEFDALTVKKVTFQSFETEDMFDMVLMHNVINHLNEDACQRLHRDQEARKTYREIFADLWELVTPGGVVLIADADRYHFYKDLGMEHPLAGNIEWEKHQPPSVWLDLLADVGFRRRRLGWTPAASLGPLAPLTSNYIISHFLRSHFCLVVEKTA